MNDHSIKTVEVPEEWFLKNEEVRRADEALQQSADEGLNSQEVLITIQEKTMLVHKGIGALTKMSNIDPDVADTIERVTIAELAGALRLTRELRTLGKDKDVIQEELFPEIVQGEVGFTVEETVPIELEKEEQPEIAEVEDDEPQAVEDEHTENAESIQDDKGDIETVKGSFAHEEVADATVEAVAEVFTDEEVSAAVTQAVSETEESSTESDDEDFEKESSVDFHLDIEDSVIETIISSEVPGASEVLELLLSHPKGTEFSRREILEVVNEDLSKHGWQKLLKTLSGIPQFQNNGLKTRGTRYSIVEIGDALEAFTDKEMSTAVAEGTPLKGSGEEARAKILQLMKEHPGRAFKRQELLEVSGVPTGSIHYHLNWLIESVPGFTGTGNTTSRRFTFDPEAESKK